ncbi:SDR family NAD(P)-dependent oxidoreductase, partial [Mycolicibacterium sp. CBMA 361]
MESSKLSSTRSDKKVAIVTGGATGLGAAAASKLVEAGYSVVITGRRRE